MGFFNLHYLPANSLERNENIEPSVGGTTTCEKIEKPLSRRTRISSVDFSFGFRRQKKKIKNLFYPTTNAELRYIVGTFFRRNSALNVCERVVKKNRHLSSLYSKNRRKKPNEDPARFASLHDVRPLLFFFLPTTR